MDSQYDEKLETIKIKRFSPAYFELAKKFPELEKYLSLGDKVVFSFRNKMIEIADEGEEKVESLNKLF